MKIAVAGKGGSGKTLLAGSLAFLFARAGRITLAIDADSAPNLGFLLGLTPGGADTLVPVSKNADLIAAKTGTPYPGVYALNFSVDDVVTKYAVSTPAGPHLLVMGTVTSMGAGCTCPANSVVRALLRHLLVERDEVVILDMEAGVEHIGRGTAESVDVMLVTSDAHRQSLVIAGRIAKMAQDSGIPRVELVGNRIQEPGQETVIRDFARVNALTVAGMIPFDPAVTRAGVNGDSISTLLGSATLEAISGILTRICPGQNVHGENV
ncbi:cobyrinic acid a,c-diamide synthase [Methanoregula sp.]|uniref:ATP-binding protein n=1 Tax=Methanoregula sp. TaxID=2052170 RepID=UPI002B55FBC2|nr:cobyrinic acid a,c-diamide synthase [Methanoregula sp.]HVP95803.1 cobyrinic acid a,c-diamide synthase [Methanoregula sp.]